MATTTFDTEAFNDAAKALWDEAYRRGYRQGEEDTIHETAVHFARSFLEIAETLLRNAVGDDQAQMAALARMTLGKTPLVNLNIDRALVRLHYDPRENIDAPKALEYVQTALKELS